MGRKIYKYQQSEDIIGKSFGRLTITKWLGVINKNTTVEAVCECGIVKTYQYSALLKAKCPTKSCGCLGKEQLPFVNIKHNLSGHPLYSVWEGMIRRCYDTTDDWYKHYGERGVTVCDEWRNDVRSFYNWAINNGWKKGLKLDKDKLSPNKSGYCYCPEYCCFITHRENMWFRNDSRMLKYKNEEKCLAEWCFILGLKESLVHYRIKKGWSIEKAFELPTITVQLLEYNGEKRSLTDWCKKLNLKEPTIYKRISKGMSINDAFSTPINNKCRNKKAA